MNNSATSTTFVLRNRVYRVDVSSSSDGRTIDIVLALNGRSEWSLTVAGWRGVLVGSARDVSYFWSARELVELPIEADTELRVTSVDEDLLFVFRVDRGWLLVCETSVRLLIMESEAERTEFGEVVESAEFEHDRLLIFDAAGREHHLRVDGDQIIALS